SRVIMNSEVREDGAVQDVGRRMGWELLGEEVAAVVDDAHPAHGEIVKYRLDRSAGDLEIAAFPRLDIGPQQHRGPLSPGHGGEERLPTNSGMLEWNSILPEVKWAVLPQVGYEPVGAAQETVSGLPIARP